MRFFFVAHALSRNLAKVASYIVAQWPPAFPADSTCSRWRFGAGFLAPETFPAGIAPRSCLPRRDFQLADPFRASRRGSHECLPRAAQNLTQLRIAPYFDAYGGRRSGAGAGFPRPAEHTTWVTHLRRVYGVVIHDVASSYVFNGLRRWPEIL